MAKGELTGDSKFGRLELSNATTLEPKRPLRHSGRKSHGRIDAFHGQTIENKIKHFVSVKPRLHIHKMLSCQLGRESTGKSGPVDGIQRVSRPLKLSGRSDSFSAAVEAISDLTS